VTAVEIVQGARALTADLHARVERYLTPSPGDGFRGSVVMHEVPHTGDGPRRLADVIALNFYRGRPPIVGVEIKATRGDWLHELDDQAKAQAWAAHCCEWWIAAPPGVVLPGELPTGWGLLHPHPTRKTTMVAVRPAVTYARPTVPGWLLTAAAKKIDSERVGEVNRAVAKALAAAEVQAARLNARMASSREDNERRRDADDAHILRTLLAAAGITRRPWGLLADPPNSPEGRALLAAADGLARLLSEQKAAEDALRGVVGDLDRARDRISRALDTVDRIGGDRPPGQSPGTAPTPTPGESGLG